MMKPLHNTKDPEHARRINKALHYIEDHLAHPLSLARLSQVACYSPFHFHRLFKAYVGESLNTYIVRKRIEKAAGVLIRRHSVNIAALALRFGFQSHAAFDRAFKKYYGHSPSSLYKQNPGPYSKIGKTHSKNGQAIGLFDEYISDIKQQLNWIAMHGKIEVCTLPALHLATVTQIGDQGMQAAFGRVIAWANAKGYMALPDVKLARIFYDSYKVTAPEKVRMGIGVTLNQPHVDEEDVCGVSIDEGRYIVGHFTIGMNGFGKAWESLFVWMGEQGYKKAPTTPYEIYHNDYRQHPEQKCEVSMYIPIE